MLIGVRDRSCLFSWLSVLEVSRIAVLLMMVCLGSELSASLLVLDPIVPL